MLAAFLNKSNINILAYIDWGLYPDFKIVELAVSRWQSPKISETACIHPIEMLALKSALWRGPLVPGFFVEKTSHCAHFSRKYFQLPFIWL